MITKKLLNRWKLAYRGPWWFTFIAAFLLLALFVSTLYYFFYQTRDAVNNLILQDLKRLVSIMHSIDRNCSIVGFTQNKNNIDFLNIKHNGFTGSHIGSIELRRPENWQGPYVVEPIKLQGFYYYILKSSSGNYIVPGDGVRLSTGKILGKDININADTNIENLLRQFKNDLWENGKPLIARLELGQNNSAQVTYATPNSLLTLPCSELDKLDS